MIGEEYGDIFLDGISFSDADSFGQDGYLIPLEDLLEEYAPNAMKILDTMPNGQQKCYGERWPHLFDARL